MHITALPQFAKNANRFREIVTILTKYGLARWLSAVDPEFVRGLLKSSEGERLADMPPEVRLRKALIELGPTFIKLGQIMSTRAELVGPDYAAELTKL
ncbi:MAG: AarF/ABC1/UbiB kinase family protein, partial [Planctomycetota bacterium]